MPCFPRPGGLLAACLLAAALLGIVPAVPGVCAAELPAGVQQALRQAGIPPSHVAVLAQRVDEPRPRLAWNAEQAMNPASVIKLLTTFAALERLGPAHVWQTEAWINGSLDKGVLTGDLILRGGGDPRLTHEQFGRLLRQLRQRGLREIRGDLVLDRGLFDLPPVDPGSFDGQPLRPYNVSPDALLVNFGAVSLTLVPDSPGNTVTLVQEPPVANLDIVNRLRLTGGNGGATVGGGNGGCGDWREALRADTFVHGETVRLVLSGGYPAACGEQRWNLAPMPPRLLAFGVFRALWEELGGSLSGNLRDGEVPASARRLAVLPSSTLLDAVRDINKFSNNVMARQLFLSLGAANGKRPVRVEDGDAAVREWLAGRGLAFPELVMENGSGLGRQARMSADSLGRLLLAAWRSPVMPELVGSLPVTAVDGTMRKRLKENGAAGQAHLKTGSLEGVKTIAGYLLDRSGRRWVIVFLVNHPRAVAAGPAQDALVEWAWQH